MSGRYRESGIYAARGALEFPVAFVDRGRVAMRRFEGAPHLADTVAIQHLTGLRRVRTVARWRGVRVVVTQVRPSRLAWFRLYDADLAAELDLYGDARRGWSACAPLHELEELGEEIEDLLPEDPQV